MEGAALGARNITDHGDCAAASANVRIALHYSPKSIHLRAAAARAGIDARRQAGTDRRRVSSAWTYSALLTESARSRSSASDVGRSGETLLCCGALAADADRHIMTQEVWRRAQFPCRP